MVMGMAMVKVMMVMVNGSSDGDGDNNDGDGDAECNDEGFFVGLQRVKYHGLRHFTVVDSAFL